MNVSGGEVFRPEEMVAYQDGSVVSRQVLKNESGTFTLFAFGEGEGLSEHTTPHDAVVTVIDGSAEVTVLGKTQTVAAGEAIFLPGGEPHAVHAHERFKMALLMLKNREGK